MSNENIIKLFLNKEKGHTAIRTISNGIYQYKGQTLSSTGSKLINYSTVIAYWKDSKLYLNTQKYSVTTTKIQNKIRQLATDRNIEIIDYKGEI